MGGSGSDFLSETYSPKAIAREIREAEAQTKNQQFEVEVSSMIGSLLAQYNDRDTEAIRNYINNIKDALNKDIEGTVNILFGGSVAKHTYVDGLSDIDALVLIDKTELADKSPREVKEYFSNRLQERFSKQPEIGKLAVTIQFKNAEIQLLPALKQESGYKISDSTGEQWSAIKPTEFTDVLTNLNQLLSKKLIPTIKLAKSIISNLPKSQRLSGYHTESLAVEVFSEYNGQARTKDMLKHFFSEAARKIHYPIKDKTGQSTHVDDYLEAENSKRRQIISRSLDRISRRMKNADGANSVEQWREILDPS
ncbi:CBASS oligonucleotide cyclase [Anabaena azotica]|uniref:Nucleotidyltransferase n=1 Tax=Anabaena azotica FACHB-119 TaxID=947527 RepID=A0ABR8D5B1_9NOST|nr:CBASS oligonucleotide cyclase [Anabaena azotica]MBD2501889.1 nucleotidyltransferase [Anabaena azotica FACHB-119]